MIIIACELGLIDLIVVLGEIYFINYKKSISIFCKNPYRLLYSASTGPAFRVADRFFFTGTAANLNGGSSDGLHMRHLLLFLLCIFGELHLTQWPNSHSDE
jgi:hypothetical protein